MPDFFGLYGVHSKTLLSQGGKTIVHTNRREMEFLFPGLRVVPVNPLETSVIPLTLVRGMEPVRFPLDRKDFR